MSGKVAESKETLFKSVAGREQQQQQQQQHGAQRRFRSDAIRGRGARRAHTKTGPFDCRFNRSHPVLSSADIGRFLLRDVRYVQAARGNGFLRRVNEHFF